MANTTPDNIYFPTRDEMIAPLETVFAAAAASVQTALSTRAIRDYRWDTTTQRDSQTGMRKGDEGKVLADMSRWVFDGTKWVAASTVVLNSQPAMGGKDYNGTGPVIFKTINAVVDSNGQGKVITGWPGGAFPNGLLGFTPAIGDGDAFAGWATSVGSNASEMRVIIRTPAGPQQTRVRIGGVAVGW